MTGNEHHEFAAAMTALASTFGRLADEALLSGYKMALDDMPLADIKRAVREAIRSCKFMPSGVELRELAGVYPPSVRSSLAFEKLSAAVIRHGSGASVDFDDQVINATVRCLGGWPRVCLLPAEQFDVWLRKDFERIYAGLMRCGITPEQAAPLIGEYESSNRMLGYLIGETLRLGDGSEVFWKPDGVRTGLPQHTDPRLRIEDRRPMQRLGVELELKQV